MWLVFQPEGHGVLRIIAAATTKEIADEIARDHDTRWILEYPLFTSVEAYKANKNPITCGGKAA